MRVAIDGIVYDTETAHELARKDDEFWSQTLFQTPGDACFFVTYEHEEPDDLTTVSNDEAAAWLVDGTVTILDIERCRDLTNLEDA